MSRYLPWLAELQPEMFAEIDPVLARARGIEDGGWMTIVSTARAEIEARATVTRADAAAAASAAAPSTRSALPWHWGYGGPVATGDAANDLITLSGDPNTTIQESKAFVVRRARRARVARHAARLAGVRDSPERPGRADEDHPAEERAARDDRARDPARPSAAAHGVLHRHDDVHRLQGVRGGLQAVERPARRRRRAPQRAAPTTTRASSARRRGATCASSRSTPRRPSAPTRTPWTRARQDRSTWSACSTPPLDRWVFMSDVCKHCTNAGCLDACPTGALIRTEFETVVLQPDVCNGCGYCVPSCPFGVVDRDHDDGRAAKCTLCYDRLEDGLEPACAKACPTDSIQFGPTTSSSTSAQRRVADAARARRRRAPTSTARATRPRTQLAGGLGAFFLLTEPPERYGLPAQADSPIQENVVPATLAAMGAGLLAAAGVAARVRRCVGGKRARAR